jgi:prolipoprotein diacylglyceryltransferase
MLSLPMIALGIALLLVAYRRKPVDPDTTTHLES